MSEEKKAPFERGALMNFFHNVLTRMKKLYKTKYGTVFVQQSLGECMNTQTEVDCSELIDGFKIAESADIAVKYLDVASSKNIKVFQVFYKVWSGYYHEDQISVDL